MKIEFKKIGFLLVKAIWYIICAISRLLFTLLQLCFFVIRFIFKLIPTTILNIDTDDDDEWDDDD
jgi:hypothetical protein